jgi:two-component system LytT family response regulator
MKIKALLIDDERLARKELTTLLAEHPEIEIIGEAANAEVGISMIDKLNPDLVFLDIQMPEKSGFDMLEEMDEVPNVVFVTAYDEYAIKAFEVNALDYLLKPVDANRLAETIKKISGKQKEAPKETSVNEEKLGSNSQIFLKDGDKCWFVTLKDVRMFESEGNYVRVYFGKNKPLILKSLNNLEERLDNKTFFRANRKYIINLKWVEGIENWFNGGLQVELRDGEKVEVSRRQASRFKDLMSL